MHSFVAMNGCNSGIGKGVLAFYTSNPNATIVAALTREECDLSDYTYVKKNTSLIPTETTDLLLIAGRMGITSLFETQNSPVSGMDQTFQVNFLSQALLLLQSLKQCPDLRRVVYVSSGAIARVVGRGNAMQYLRGYAFHSRLMSYAVSKFLMMLFIEHLESLPQYEHISFYSIDPGNVRTNIYNPVWKSSSILSRIKQKVRKNLSYTPLNSAVERIVNHKAMPRLSSVPNQDRLVIYNFVQDVTLVNDSCTLYDKYRCRLHNHDHLFLNLVQAFGFVLLLHVCCFILTYLSGKKK